MNFSYGEHNVFYVMNMIIFLENVIIFLEKCKSNGKLIVLLDFLKMFNDKLESIRMCHMLNNDLEKFVILYDKFMV